MQRVSVTSPGGSIAVSTAQQSVEPDSVGTKLAVREDHYCFGCGGENPHGLKLTFFANDAGEVWTDWHPVRENEGFTGMAHGGMISTVLDEVMGWAVYYKEIWAVTGKLSVSFRRPVAIGEATRATARITEEHGRKLKLTADLRRLSDGQLLAEAESVFIKVPPERAEEWRARYYDPEAAPKT